MISNKLIGLAALAFLCGSAGFTAVGCSSTTVEGDDDDDADAATTSSSSGTVRRDSGASSSGDEPLACAPATTYAGGWFDAAKATAGSCSAAQITAFNTKANEAGATYEDLYNSITGACRSCVFTDVGDASADVESMAAIGIVTSGASKGGGIINSGWCIGNKSGKPACGNAYGSFQECGDTVCKDCGTTDDQGVDDEDKDSCKTAAYDGETAICQTATSDALLADCGQDGLAFESECTGTGISLLTIIEDLCGGAATDGGVVGDAGADAN